MDVTTVGDIHPQLRDIDYALSLFEMEGEGKHKIQTWISRLNSRAPRDELSEEDKLTVHRARRIQFFLSQNFHVAEQFTEQKGSYVPVKDTIRGFKEILGGKHDDLTEEAFRLVGPIEDAIEKAKTLV